MKYLTLIPLVLSACAQAMPHAGPSPYDSPELALEPSDAPAAGAPAPELYEPGRVVRGPLPVIDHLGPERDCVDYTPITVVGENFEPGSIVIVRYPFHDAELEPLETRWSSHTVVQFEIDPAAQWEGMPRWTDGYYTVEICGVTGCSNAVDMYRHICVDASDWG